MSRPGSLVLASGNPGKLAELRGLLEDTGIELVAQTGLGVAEAEETGASFIENALLKARHAARATGLPALADDSGLCVDALDGAPGLQTARYAGPGADAHANIARLLGALAGIAPADRGAHFHCVVALVRHAGDPAPLVCEGVWRGRVLDAPLGEGGFGYDPVFLDPALGLSAAQLDAATKQRVSHRAQALRQLRARLDEF
ncbi:MAG TPA: RdgB/HAM1 family non-canonical purine NTP pyrophosphatase [Xanthomonadaceae bacterium]|nr:RdgB/HAM1 family non-canonical purine NTP pyrophosphatase [Xanthomonadaceae bacterium]